MGGCFSLSTDKKESDASQAERLVHYKPLFYLKNQLLTDL